MPTKKAKTPAKKQAAAEEHGILAVFREASVAVVDGQQRTVREGSVYALRKVELAGAALSLTLRDDGKIILAMPSAVRIYVGPVPDWRLEMHLAPNGYQAEIYEHIQCLTLQCRDFGGTHSTPDLCRQLSADAASFLKQFRSQH